jgi:hypothetical protein
MGQRQDALIKIIRAVRRNIDTGTLIEFDKIAFLPTEREREEALRALLVKLKHTTETGIATNGNHRRI